MAMQNSPYDVPCPYCGKDVDLYLTEGLSHEDGGVSTDTCPHCGEEFTIKTSVLYVFSTEVKPED